MQQNMERTHVPWMASKGRASTTLDVIELEYMKINASLEIFSENFFCP